MSRKKLSNGAFPLLGSKKAKTISKINQINDSNYENYLLWRGDVETYLDNIEKSKKFDLVVTSPPYNVGKEYEKKKSMSSYLNWQESVIRKIEPHISEHGSICWQTGNFINKGEIIPLDIKFHPIFESLGLKLRNRIIWKFGHGLHCKKRFSGRYEVVMWYTKNDNYVFNLDPVRIPSKYPGKKHFKGPNVGKLSGNPLGKNPEDVWNIPNVKSNHIEKTNHPCQFPVGLIERLILAMTNKKQTVFDPFSGVGSAGVAAAITGRKFTGCEINSGYVKVAKRRINETLSGKPKYRPHSKPIYDHTKSNLSKIPEQQNDHRIL